MKSANPYRKTKLQTASPVQRIVMLYDGILKNLRLVVELLADPGPNELVEVNNKLILAGQIVLELKLALDLDQGGEVAENLNRLYAFWLDRISEANVQKDAEIVNDVIELVADVRDTWAQIQAEANQLGQV